MKWIFPLTILVIFELIADILAKSWSIHRGWFLAVGALTAYVLANTFWLFALKNGSGLGRGAVIFSVSSAILAIFVGIVLYHETVTRLQIFGMLFGIIAIVLLFWE